MRGSILLAAVAVAFSTGAIAQDDMAQTAPAKATAIKLGDAELDQITAGESGVVIFNPGKGVVDRLTSSPFVCVNCITLPAELLELGAGGAVVNRGNPNGRYIGGWRGFNL